MNRGMWTVVAAAVAMAVGIVIGEQLRSDAAADRARDASPAGPAFQLAQVDPSLGGAGPRGFGGGGTTRTYLNGRLKSVDPAASTITVVSEGQRQETQTVQVPPTVRILRQSSTTVSDVKVGETVTVGGQPLQMNIGEVRIEAPQRQDLPGGVSRVGPGGGTADSGGRVGMPPAGPLPTDQIRVTGQVLSLQPLKIRIGDRTECTLHVQPGSSVFRVSEAALADLKPGESVSGFAYVPDGAPLTATNTLRVGFEENPAGRRPGIGGF